MKIDLNNGVIEFNQGIPAISKNTSYSDFLKSFPNAKNSLENCGWKSAVAIIDPNIISDKSFCLTVWFSKNGIESIEFYASPGANDDFSGDEVARKAYHNLVFSPFIGEYEWGSVDISWEPRDNYSFAVVNYSHKHEKA